jgi:hypothetical protein
VKWDARTVRLFSEGAGGQTGGAPRGGWDSGGAARSMRVVARREPASQRRRGTCNRAIFFIFAVFIHQSPASLSLSFFFLINPVSVLAEERNGEKRPDSENGELKMCLQSCHVFWRKIVKSHCRQVDMKNQESCGFSL